MIPEYRIQKRTTTISKIVRPSRFAGQIHGVKQAKEQPLMDNATNLLEKQKGQVQKESGLQRLQVRLRRWKKAMPRLLLLHLHPPRRRFRRPIHLGCCSARTPYSRSTRGKWLLPSRSCVLGFPQFSVSAENQGINYASNWPISSIVGDRGCGRIGLRPSRGQRSRKGLSGNCPAVSAALAWTAACCSQRYNDGRRPTVVAGPSVGSCCGRRHCCGQRRAKACDGRWPCRCAAALLRAVAAQSRDRKYRRGGRAWPLLRLMASPQVLWLQRWFWVATTRPFILSPHGSHPDSCTLDNLIHILINPLNLIKFIEVYNICELNLKGTKMLLFFFNSSSSIAKSDLLVRIRNYFIVYYHCHHEQRFANNG